MRRSKLDMYIDLLKVLALNGPTKLTRIMYQANVNCAVLREIVDKLAKEALIEQRNIRKKGTFFAITQRGITTLKHYRELNELLPIVEEATPQVPTPY